MKFRRRLYFSIIPEWRDQYIDFSALAGQIDVVKSSVIKLAKSYTRVKLLIGDRRPINIDISSVKEEQRFWTMVEENLRKVDAFHNALLKEFIERFHILTYQAIQLDLIEEFVPFTRGLSTQLQREFQRLRLSETIGLSSTQELEYRKFLNQKGKSRLVSINRHSRIEDVIEQLNKMSKGQMVFGGRAAKEDAESDKLSRRAPPRSSQSAAGKVQEGEEEGEGFKKGLRRLSGSSPLGDVKQGAPSLGGHIGGGSKPVPIDLDDSDSDSDGHSCYSLKENRVIHSASAKSGGVHLKPSSNSISRMYMEERPGLFGDGEDDWGDKSDNDDESKMEKDGSLMSVKSDIFHLDGKEDGQEGVKSEDSGYVSGGSEEVMFDEGGETEAAGTLDRDVLLGGAGLSHEQVSKTGSLSNKTGSETERPEFKEQMLNMLGGVPDGAVDDDDISLNVNADANEVTIGLRDKRDGEGPSVVEEEKRDEGLSQKTIFEPLPDLKKINCKKATEALRVAYSEMYRGLYLLKNFDDMNLQVVEKLATKHEKHVAPGTRLKFHQEILPKYSFYRPKELRSLIRETEHVYSCAFTNGHRTKAMRKLRVPKDSAGSVEKENLYFGFLLGVTVGLVTLMVYLFSIMSGHVIEKLRPGFVVFLMLALAIVMLWYWGVDMYVWSHYRVNYIFIFGFNSRGHLRHQDIFDAASIFSVILALMMIFYVLAIFQLYDPNFRVAGFQWLTGVSPDIFPSMSILLAVAVFLFYSIKSQFWLVCTLCRIFAAPFYPVLFKDFFLADQLISLAIIFVDLDMVFCYYLTSAFRDKASSCVSYFFVQVILNALPYLWRFMQCLRRFYDGGDTTQLYNAGKYAVGIVACALASTYLFNSKAWTIASYVVLGIATVYSYIWDVYKDWSVGDIYSKNWLLRDQLLYPKPWYYLAMALNLVMKFLWTLNISKSGTSVFHLDEYWSKKILALVEVTRRAMWNIFRLENEQLNNCGKFRAIRDLPLPLPLIPEAEIQLFQKD
ncbi:uncharacterized protein LOC126313357 [Schistocerca gregaria]|uniref:uncharacterized protein LOC126313357 n=1 Tax=Schistocerca gregaria TaxID=7010 RepID=UPI00211E4B48|nr:uncharacterized protein LOC126313357 [Schistocerca gregaria]